MGKKKGNDSIGDLSFVVGDLTGVMRFSSGRFVEHPSSAYLHTVVSTVAEFYCHHVGRVV